MRIALLLALSRDGGLENSLPTLKFYRFHIPNVTSEMFVFIFFFFFLESEPLQRHSRLLMASLKDFLVNVLAQQ